MNLKNRENLIKFEIFFVIFYINRIFVIHERFDGENVPSDTKLETTDLVINSPKTNWCTKILENDFVVYHNCPSYLNKFQSFSFMSKKISFDQHYIFS